MQIKNFHENIEELEDAFRLRVVAFPYGYESVAH